MHILLFRNTLQLFSTTVCRSKNCRNNRRTHLESRDLVFLLRHSVCCNNFWVWTYIAYLFVGVIKCYLWWVAVSHCLLYKWSCDTQNRCCRCRVALVVTLVVVVVSSLRLVTCWSKWVLNSAVVWRAIVISFIDVRVTLASPGKGRSVHIHEIQTEIAQPFVILWWMQQRSSHAWAWRRRWEVISPSKTEVIFLNKPEPI